MTVPGTPVSRTALYWHSIVFFCKAHGGDRESSAAFNRTLFVLAQATASQAQVTVDVSKITCEQFLLENPWPSKYVVFWLNGYYNGERDNTIIEPESMDERGEKVESYCNNHHEMTVMDAVKNVLGFENERTANRTAYT
jgi:acid stress chaperone HdeB